MSDGAFKLTFGTLVVATAFGATHTATGSNLSEYEPRLILVLGTVVNGVLLLGALLIPRSKTATNVALALVTLGSVFTAYIIHTELYSPENRATLVAVCGAALFGLFVAFRVIDEHRWGGWVLSGAAVAGVAGAGLPETWRDLISGFSTPGGLLAPDSPRFWAALIGLGGVVLLALFAAARFMSSRAIDVSRWGGVALLAAISIGGVVVVLPGLAAGGDGWEKHLDVRAITFQETPNVYFVGFDAVVPRSIMKKYMGIETTEFHEVLDVEARRFRNLFANSVMTSASFGTLMALDLEIYLNHRHTTGRDQYYFAGHDLSPLVWIMRENGYETSSIYNDTFFGHSQGPYIDNYVINRKTWGVCARLDEGIRRWAFWGYCRILEASWPQDAGLSRGDFLLQELTGLESRKPQFVVAYLYMPGHTSNTFSYGDEEDRKKYKEYYHRESDKAGSYLNQIIEHLGNNDPNAILFVFGDHGAVLSRGMDVEDDPTFFLQDRFGILGGVYPPDRCAEYFDETESKGYMTILDAVHAILSCLSGGQSAVVGTRHDRFSGSGVPREHEYRYEEFLYE